MLQSILKQREKDDNISDIHITTGEPIAYRHNGDIKKQEDHIIDSQQMNQIIQEVFPTEQQYENFLTQKDTDFSYVSESGTPYRVNTYFRTGNIAISIRKLNQEARKLESLMFSHIATAIKEQILNKKKGLFLVTGATGSGKSTSIVSMLEYINETKPLHIITIEDPVEFIFKPKKCIISQREVNNDTASFSTALRASMREDPNIIFVGEIRDYETAEAVLRIAESGHLVLSTLHTPSAALTINRFISFFSPDVQNNVCDRFADIILGIQSQTLVKTADESQRVGIFELMFTTPAIRNNIKKKDIAQINSIIETSASTGMISMKKYAQKMVDKGIIKNTILKTIKQQLNID